MASSTTNREQLKQIAFVVLSQMNGDRPYQNQRAIAKDRFLEEKDMPYVMLPCEQDAMNRGALQTRREDIIDILVLKFSEVPEQIADRINKLEDASLLRELFQRSVTIASLSDFSVVLDRLTTAEDSSGPQNN